MTTQTFSLLAPTPFAQFDVRYNSGVLVVADGFGLITGATAAMVGDLVGMGCINLGPGTLNDAAAWNANAAAPVVIAAAGSTQGAATLITSNNVFVNTTTSSEGCEVQAVATGAVTEGYVIGSHGFKLYPPKNGKFDSVTTTNEAKVITANTGFRVRQRSATAYSLQYI